MSENKNLNLEKTFSLAVQNHQEKKLDIAIELYNKTILTVHVQMHFFLNKKQRSSGRHSNCLHHVPPNPPCKLSGKYAYTTYQVKPSNDSILLSTRYIIVTYKMCKVPKNKIYKNLLIIYLLTRIAVVNIPKEACKQFIGN